MFPTTLSLIFALALLQDSGTGIAIGQGTQDPKPAPKPAPQEPWEALKNRISQRLELDRKRLAKVLKPYLSDLALDASANRKYLEGRYDEIAALDPDIGLVLLPMLAPKGKDRKSRFRADNSMRVLEKTRLAPLENELLGMLEKKHGPAQNRALYLLTGFKKSGLDKVLLDHLKNTPEALLPGVIEAVGRYGRSSMAKTLEPFLSRPDERQSEAAFLALCQIASAQSLGPLMAAAKGSGKATDRTRLILYLSTLGGRTGKAGWRADEALFFEALTWLLSQGEGLRAEEIQKLLRLVQTRPAKAGLEKGGEKLTSTLNRLLTNPYPNVQFGAALALRHLGDKQGVKKVLEGLSRFVKNNRKLSYAYRQRGRAYDAFGEISDALRDYKQAISLSAGRVDPGLYFAVARLEAKKGSASNVLRYLKEAEPTRQELERFRARVPEVQVLIRRSNQLRRLFENS